MASRDGGAGRALSLDGARGRILETAYELFSRDGIRAVGIDRIIDEAGIAKATLYRHFPSKEQLVIAFLDLRQQRWTREWLEFEAESKAPRPEERALSVYDALDEWFQRPDYEGCAFIKTLLEMNGTESPVRRAAAQHLGVVHAVLSRYARSAGAGDPEAVGHQLQILMMGAIVSASRGDERAAQRARSVAGLLLESSR